MQIQAVTSKGKLDENDQAAMQGFVLEALRIDPPFTGAYRTYCYLLGLCTGLTFLAMFR